MGVLGHLWWLIPAAIVLCAVLAAFLGPGATVVAAWAKSAPRAVWLAMAGVMVLGFSFQCGRWYERSVAQERQEAAEKRADAKGEIAAKRAHGAAQKARDTIRKESDDAQAEVRTIVRTLPATCPDQPDRLRELGRAAVESAGREVLPAEGR